MDRGEGETTERDEARLELGSIFDELKGFFLSVEDVYSRAHLKKQLDILYDATWTGRELDEWFTGKLRSASSATKESSSSAGMIGGSEGSSAHAGSG